MGTAIFAGIQKNEKFIYNPPDEAEKIIFRLKKQKEIRGNYIYTTSYQKSHESWTNLNNAVLEAFDEMRNDSLTQTVSGRIPDGENDRETLQNILDFFKSNYEWSNTRSPLPIFTDERVVELGFGHSADLNLWLNSILTAKNIDSKLIMLSTRENGKIIMDFPYLGQFNALVNLVTTEDNEQYLIDASDLSQDLGFAPLENFNLFGLELNNSQESFLELSPPISKYFSTMNYIFKDGKFTLIQTDKRDGYFKSKQKDAFKGIENPNFMNKAVDLIMEEVKQDFKESDENNFNIQRIHYVSEEISDLNFFTIGNPLKTTLNSFRLTESIRHKPLEFDFPFYINATVNIIIPDGYKATMPFDFNRERKLKNDEIVYIQQAKITENKVVMHFEFLLGKSIFFEGYPTIKHLFDTAISDSEKVILLKKE